MLQRIPNISLYNETVVQDQIFRIFILYFYIVIQVFQFILIHNNSVKIPNSVELQTFALINYLETQFLNEATKLICVS